MTFNYRILFLFLILASCKQVQKVSDAIINPSAREIFERDFQDNDSILNRYKIAYKTAKQNQLQLDLPSVLQSKSETLDFKFLAYTVNLNRGERFKIESDITPDRLQLAIDLFSFINDSVISEEPLLSNEPESNILPF